ncbi:MAG: hypothetical protein ABJA87_03760 [bacterium]
MTTRRPTVFALLADPIQLSSWVRGVTAVERNSDAGQAVTDTVEDGFRLRLGELAAVGKVIGYEPPWYGV